MLHGHTALESTLKPDLFRSFDLQDFRSSRLVVNFRQHNRATNHELWVFKIRIDTSKQAWVVDRIWEVDLALGRFRCIHGSSHRYHSGQASHGAYEPPLHGFIGDQELDSAVGLFLDYAHQHQRVDELAAVRFCIAIQKTGPCDIPDLRVVRTRR